ncbi:MAG: hypothetical protein KDA85_13015 [Planctomycetaceae bacterium]|nr:hypothetical protein [Planctomycetaceae bacterium]
MRGQLLIIVGVLILMGLMLAAFVQRDPAADPENTVVTAPAAGGEAHVSGPSATSPGETAVSSTPAKTSTDTAPSDPGTPTLQFPDWPEPAVALIVTGEQHGYFEPCGCTAGQLGGMSRRADLAKKIRDLGWNQHGIDLGGVARRTGPQALLKFDTTLAALREMNYLAIGLGPDDLQLSPENLLAQHLIDTDDAVYFLSANVVFFGTPELGTPLPWRIVETGGMKIGITSVLSESLRKQVIPDRPDDPSQPPADLSWESPEKAIPSVLAKFDEDNVGYRILLSQGSLEETRGLVEKFPAFDLVVTAEGFGDGERDPELIGHTRLLQVGTKGKFAGVVGLYPNDDKQPCRFELVSLNGEQFQHSDVIVELMRKYQQRLHDERIVEIEGAVAYPSGAEFVGADKCGECHTKAMEVWQNTAHAHALESLDPAFQREGHERLMGVARTFDPECLACHVTGWSPEGYLRYRTGFINAEFAADEAEKKLETLLAGNQCENCHGPGSRHVEQIELGNVEAARMDVRVTLQQAKERTCVMCHDADNSPHYSFEEYWEQVRHPGLD